MAQLGFFPVHMFYIYNPFTKYLLSSSRVRGNILGSSNATVMKVDVVGIVGEAYMKMTLGQFDKGKQIKT